MQTELTLTGKLENIERLPSSANGNPRYTFTVNNIACRTKPDTGVAYSLPNYDDKQVIITARNYYGYLSLITIKKEDDQQ